MLFKYCIFCFGCGLIQQSPLDAYGGKSGFYMPLWMSSQSGKLFTLLISICALISEIYIGITLFNIWIGIFFWLVAFIVAILITNEFKEANPMIALVLGIAIIVVSSLLLYEII